MFMKFSNFVLKEKPLFVRTPQSENKSLKRKILSSESPPHDDDGMLLTLFLLHMCVCVCVTLVQESSLSKYEVISWY